MASSPGAKQQEEIRGRQKREGKDEGEKDQEMEEASGGQLSSEAKSWN